MYVYVCMCYEWTEIEVQKLEKENWKVQKSIAKIEKVQYNRDPSSKTYRISHFEHLKKDKSNFISQWNWVVCIVLIYKGVLFIWQLDINTLHTV